MGWDGMGSCVKPSSILFLVFGDSWREKKKQRKHSNFLTSNLFVYVGKRTRKNTPSRL